MDSIIPTSSGNPTYIYGFYFVIMIILYFVYSQIYLASNDAKAFTKNFNYNLLVIAAPIILILFFILFLSFDASFSMPILIISIIACIGVYILFYLGKTGVFDAIFNSYMLYVLIGLISLVGLSIIYVILSEKIRKLPGWVGFFANLLFYIPCMIRDMVGYISTEYANTSNTLIILFILEILLFMMYFYILPFAYNKSFPEKMVLLHEPVMLNTQKYIDEPLMDMKKSSNSSISFWLYLNPGPNNKISYTKETTMFNYSDSNETIPHIRISYSNENGNNDFNMYVGSQMFKITLPLQKWHNFVINFVSYDEAIPTPPPESPENTDSSHEQPVIIRKYNTDIFINGELERSYDFKTETTETSETSETSTVFDIKDIIYTGSGGITNSNIQGLYGAICNVVYYKVPLTKLAIVYNYNLYSIKNPPMDDHDD
jgi:hypothetical protein